MKQSTRPISQYATNAVSLLGQLIKLARKQQKMTTTELAERAGIARSTLQRIEKGDTNCAIGLIFEVATLVGVNLFDADNKQLSMVLADTQSKIALLPKSMPPKDDDIDDDF